MAEAPNESVADDIDLPRELMDEVASLRRLMIHGKVEVEVARGSGCEDTIVKVSPVLSPYCLKFTLPGDYPLKVPKIEVHQVVPGVGDLPDESLQSILQDVYRTAQKCTGNQMIIVLVEKFFRQLLQELGSNDTPADRRAIPEDELPFPEEFEPDNSLEGSAEKPKRKVKGKRKQRSSVDSSRINTKKPPMKTATDVIHRIMWDELLNQDDFVVGYMDRFVGIIEEPFTLFEWGDIAEADLLALAIPRHRIQHFKYKDVIVWDKTQRLDDVFGSTGSKTTIRDMVRKFEKENAHSEEKELCESDGSEVERSLDRLFEDDSAGGCSDDGGHHQSEDSGRRGAKPGKKGGKPQRPTHFLAVRMMVPDLLEKIQKLQAEICESDDMLKKACIPSEKLHVTLCVMRLEDQEEIELAAEVLKDLEQEMAACFSPVTLFQFKRVECWQGRLVVAPVEGLAKETLRKGVETVCARLEEAGIKVKDDKRQFNPHLTVIKMKGWMRKKKKKYKIDNDLVKPHEDSDLGCQDVDEIHLCSMTDKPGEDGFYNTIASICTSLE